MLRILKVTYRSIAERRASATPSTVAQSSLLFATNLAGSLYISKVLIEARGLRGWVEGTEKLIRMAASGY